MTNTKVFLVLSFLWQALSLFVLLVLRDLSAGIGCAAMAEMMYLHHSVIERRELEKAHNRN